MNKITRFVDGLEEDETIELVLEALSALTDEMALATIRKWAEENCKVDELKDGWE